MKEFPEHQDDSKLQASEDNYRNLVNGNPQPMWIFAIDTFKILEVNDAAITKYGYSRKEFLELTIRDLRPQEELEKFENYVQDNLSTPLSFNQSGPWRHRLKNGEKIDVEITSQATLWKGERARVIRIWDVTERLKIENSLRAAEERYRSIFENASEGIYQSTLEGKFITVNPSLANMIGYDTPEQLISSMEDIGRQFYVDPSERLRVMDLLEKEGRVLGLESRVFTKDKKIIWIRDHIRAIKNENGTIRYCEGAMEDITERKDTEANLRLHQQFSNMIIRAQSLFIGAQDERYAFDVLLDDLLAITKSEYGFIGEVLLDANGNPYLKTHTITNIAWDEKTRAFYNDNIEEGLVFANLKTLFGQVMVTGKPVVSNSPSTDPRRGGLPKGHPPLNAFLGLPFGTEGKIEGMLGLSNRPGGYDQELINFLEPFVSNISHLFGVAQSERLRKQTATALLNSESKLQKQFDELQKTNHELDRFVYSVSHDLRAPLASILGLVNVAEIEPDKNAIQNYLGMIRESVERLDGFIKDILDYSRNSRTELRSELVDFRSLINDVQKRFKSLPNADRLKLTVEFNDKAVFYCDVTRLEIIMNNLFSNAVKYQDLQKDVSTVAIEIQITPQQMKMVFKDNGVGIEQQYFGKIFTMFYRASERSKGSGLGLYIARETAIKLGGSIDIQSTFGEGTSFQIVLPNLPRNAELKIKE